ncbi:kinase-like domain-containing protein [Gigaspora rosea]|uniref:Kinase-like domain-containing protein n=1 Tax=Gigaspora rosea TaxID=44941 RepID=A0A397VZK9_9GLOM|nr:kinase-like domain-containing protein [Gigaspora rosea]
MEEQFIKDKVAQISFTDCQKLADVNDPDGVYWLGYCYEYGIGIEKDENKAFIHYQKSADMKNSNGMYKVGYCYYIGIGVEKNNYKAFEHYKKSAEMNHLNGIFKTAICYYYGIGVDDKFSFSEWLDNESKYGKCTSCNEYNTNEAWCLSCDPDIAIRWTSGDKDIDDCMKSFQLRTFAYENVIEWIPFDKLSDIKEVGKKVDFGSVFKATWMDGIRKVDGNEFNYVRARESSSIVALKTLTSSKETNFLKEFKSLMICNLNYSKLAIYGITQNKETKLYVVTFLQGQHTDIKTQSYIADLGLSRKKDECVSEGNIYGVIPYVAPEVLSGAQQFTQAADIYGFGIIMAEMSTGQRPFDGHEFGTKLAVKICNGLRPAFARETPKCYIELAERCMNSDPQKRPSAQDIYYKINNWLYEIASSDDNEIKKQFLDADKVIKSLPIPKHSDKMYTSKIISTKLIANEIKEADSAQIKFDITKV